MGSKCVIVIVITVSMEFCLVIFVYFLTIASGLFTMIVTTLTATVQFSLLG